ncbi:MAG: hypothetical protein EA360_11745 [Balneolaceae bacterium]|nr:MAG: hypothetical protein EA360_11745 [Balneolaceae bacterium]
MKWSGYIGRQLFEPERESTLGEMVYFKIFELFVVIYTIKFSWEWGFYSQLRNVEVVLPLGIANYLDISLFFDHQLALITAAVITLLVIFAYFRIGPKWFYAVAMLLFHLQYVIRFSQGEIPHSQNLIGMSVFSLALGALFFPKKEKMARFVLGSVIFFIGLGYTSAFFAKLIGTGIHWSDGRHLWLWIGEKGIDILSREGAFAPNLLQQLALNSVAIASLILLIGWVTELIGFTMWWPRLRPYTTLLLIAMHIGITLTMNIRFDAFVMQLILVGFPWYLLLDRFLERFRLWEAIDKISGY